MTERWQQVSRLFELALDRPVAERSSFVSDTCGGDFDLRCEVESLLAEHDRSVLIDTPIADAARELLGDNRGVLTGQHPSPLCVGCGGRRRRRCYRSRSRVRFSAPSPVPA